MDRLIPSALRAHPLTAGSSGREILRVGSRLTTSGQAHLGGYSVFLSEQAPREVDPGDHAKCGRGASVLFYDGPDIRVTDKYVETVDRCFLLRETSHIHRVETLAYPARKVALICSAIELGLAAALAARYGAATLICGGLLDASALGAAILVDGRRNPRWMALCCTYGGRETTLYSSRDQRTFEAVRRAVVRAVEAAQETDI